MSLWERLGEDDAAREARLRALLSDFYRRVLADTMIGFLFAGKEPTRLVDLEFQFTRRAFGGGGQYYGRSMREAHRSSPILGGHFARRQQLLREVAQDHALPEDVIEAWLAHNELLRAQVTSDQGTQCNHDRSTEPSSD